MKEVNVLNESTRLALIEKLHQCSDLHNEISALFAEVPDVAHDEETTQTQAEAHHEQAYFCFADAEGLANPEAPAIAPL